MVREGSFRLNRMTRVDYYIVALLPSVHFSIVRDWVLSLVVSLEVGIAIYTMTACS